MGQEKRNGKSAANSQAKLGSPVVGYSDKNGKKNLNYGQSVDMQCIERKVKDQNNMPHMLALLQDSQKNLKLEFNQLKLEFNKKEKKQVFRKEQQVFCFFCQSYNLAVHFCEKKKTFINIDIFNKIILRGTTKNQVETPTVGYDHDYGQPQVTLYRSRWDMDNALWKEALEDQRKEKVTIKKEIREEEWKKVQEKGELPDKDRYYIKVDNPFSILLDKQHKVLRSKHPEIRLIPRENELEILTSSEIKEEALLARRGDKDHIIPLVGSWTHKMHWIQKGRFIALEGYGENFIQDLKNYPTFSKLSINFGEFPDEAGKLSSSIRGKGHIFVSEWPQFIWKNANNNRFIFNKHLEAIDEEVHKLAVKERIESKKIIRI